MLNSHLRFFHSDWSKNEKAEKKRWGKEQRQSSSFSWGGQRKSHRKDARSVGCTDTNAYSDQKEPSYSIPWSSSPWTVWFSIVHASLQALVLQECSSALQTHFHFTYLIYPRHPCSCRNWPKGFKKYQRRKDWPKECWDKAPFLKEKSLK